MLSKRKVKELQGAGEDYVNDWLSWERFEEKDVEGKLKILGKFDGQCEALDMAQCESDMGRRGDSRGQTEAAADWIYEGMRKVIKAETAKLVPPEEKKSGLFPMLDSKKRRIG